MKGHFKNFLNEDQDPKAIEKITTKLNDLLMKNEEVGYIGVQKKPVTVFPESIVLTNRRMILCKPKNLGLSMDFIDYAWEDIAGIFVKENILGSEFSFSTKTDISVSIDYLPKAQARKIYTYAKEQQEALKNQNTTAFHTEYQDDKPKPETPPGPETPKPEVEEPETIEEVQTEDVNDYTELIPVAFSGYRDEKQHPDLEIQGVATSTHETPSSDALFEKLQNYKKLLDNGLILQGEYDALKKEIISQM